MKNVILIGDSIRMGYQATVVAELSDIAEIWQPDENGRHSRNLVEKMDGWILSRPCDVLHINAGLHDAIRNANTDYENQIPIDEYEANLRKLLSTVKAQKPDATIIFALTTPVSRSKQVNSGKTQGDDRAGRFEDEVAAYNEVARRVADEVGVAVNDLFEWVTDNDRDKLLGADGVHFTDEAKVLMGKQVAGVIRAAL